MKMHILLIITFICSQGFAKTLWGEKVKIGRGYARTFIEIAKDTPQSVGVAISKEVLSSLPHEMSEFELPLPHKYKWNLPPYEHVTLDWNPHGHDPESIYSLPHFDVHFYFITSQVRNSITCMNEDEANCMQAPLASSLPANYAPTPAGVPKMGWHWVDLLAPEFNGGTFTHTYIYGFYKGEHIFLEPMVTLDYLRSRKSNHTAIRTPSQFSNPNGYYPQSYKISYDKKNKLHKIILTDFK